MPVFVISPITVILFFFCVEWQTIYQCFSRLSIQRRDCLISDFVCLSTRRLPDNSADSSSNFIDHFTAMELLSTYSALPLRTVGYFLALMMAAADSGKPEQTAGNHRYVFANYGADAMNLSFSEVSIRSAREQVASGNNHPLFPLIFMDEVPDQWRS